MLTGFNHLHNFMRWFVLIAVIIAIIRSLSGMRNNKPFTKQDNLWSLLTLIGYHIQLVIGIAIYIGRGWYNGLGEMSDRLIRFFSVEHAFGMLIAIVLVTVGRAKSKRAATDTNRHKTIFWYYLIAFIITLITIPWPFISVIGRSWFPGM